jgi:filamentous hemagglutinin
VAGNTINDFPNNESQTKHMFGDRPGHLIDTSANRELISNIANNYSNYLSVDRFGNSVYAQILKDGSQVWVYIRDGIIQNCGQNVGEAIRIWKDGVGLVKP